jgi:hypothetical protein
MTDIRQKMRDGEMNTPRENLSDFIDRMLEVGFEITAFFPYYEGRSYSLLSCVDIARQALNYEHTNIDFTNKETGERQTISVMMTGDIWCDIVPINDWSFRHGNTDWVDMFVKAIREEQLGEDA